MNPTIRDITPEDFPRIAEIFNQHVRLSHAAFLDQEVPAPMFGKLVESAGDRPALAAEVDGRILGFAFLKPHHMSPVFRRTAEMVIFLDQEATGLGLGHLLLTEAEKLARELGLDRIIANIAGENTGSQRFHQRHGYVEKGRLPAIGRKHGRDLDVVIMLKEL